MRDHIDAHKLMEHLVTQDDLQARFAYRFLPISIACKASGNLEEFKRLVRPLIVEFLNERK